MTAKFGRVEVAEVEVPVIVGTVSAEKRVEPDDEKFAVPAIESAVPGEVVPMPTLPEK